MKTLFAALLIALVSSTSTTVAFANDFKSEFVTSSSPPIDVPDKHVIRINAFTQTGGTSSSSRSTISALVGGTTAIVLAASRTDTNPLDPVNRIVIAGPATLTFTLDPGATAVFLTYRKTPQPD